MKRLPALVLALAMVLSLVPGNLLSTVLAAEESAVFINGSVETSGDGRSAETAVKTLEEAYALLDKEAGGTVVVCGLTKIKEKTDLEQFDITGTVELTSLWNGVNYAATNSAMLEFPIKVSIYFGAKTHVHDITMIGGSGTVYLYCGADMLMGEGITSSGTLKLFTCDAHPATKPEDARDYKMTVLSGKYDSIFMGTNTEGTYTGDAEVILGGTVDLRLLVTGGNQGHAGDLTATLLGGALEKIANTPNKANLSIGKLEINLLGGTLRKMTSYNGNTHYAESVNITIGSEMKSIPETLGDWSALFLPNSKTRTPISLSYLNYNGTAINPAGFDTVNLFGCDTIPEDFVSPTEEGKKILSIHNFSGRMGLSLNAFDKLVVTGNSEVTCAGKVPTNLVLSATDSILRIRPSRNNNVTLEDYTIENNDKVLFEDLPYTSHDVIFSIDFENEYYISAGTGVTVTPTNNGYKSSFATGGFVTGVDGGSALYIVNDFGKKAENYLTFDLSGSGYDITKDDYTVSFWYMTEMGGNEIWARAAHATTAGKDVDMNSYPMGGTIFSNQDTVLDSAGMSFLQLTHYKYVASGLTTADGTHKDTDGIWQAQDDRWHYVTVSYDRSGAYCVYVDGELITTCDIAAYAGEALGINTLVFGADALGQYGLGNAIIDNITVCHGALNYVDAQAEYYKVRMDALAKQIRTHVDKLGSEYEPYKADILADTEDALKQAAALGAKDFIALSSLYDALNASYEAFLSAPEKNALVTTLLLSDIHLGAAGTQKNLETVLKQISDLGIDLDVLISAGDFADASNVSVVNGAFRTMFGLMDTYNMQDVLFVNALGNHDVEWNSITANYQTAAPIYWERMMSRMKAGIDDGSITVDHTSYIVDENDVLQSASYAITYQNYHYLVINTDYLPQTGDSSLVKDENGNYSIDGNKVDPIRHSLHIREDSLAWMKEVLDKWANDGMPTFVVSHYAFEDTVPLSYDSEIVINSNSVGKQDKQLRTLLAGYENVFYFCGHMHSTFGIIDPYLVEVEGAGSFWEINLSTLKSVARSYMSFPHTWVMYIYEDEIVFRARDFANEKWVPQFDEVIKLTCTHKGDKLAHHPAVEATTESQGNIEYWYCRGCGKTFSDAACTAEISADSTFTPMLEKKDAPADYTGIVVIVCVLAVVAATGVAFIIKKRKKK